MLSNIRKFLTFVAVAFVLTACGGGGDDSGPPLVEVSAQVGGQTVPGFVALPGSRQAISVPVGLSFEFFASRPVSWRVFIDGNLAPGVGNTYTKNGTSVQEISITNAQFRANTFGFTPGPVPFQLTIVATSLEDPGQVTTIDVFVTN